MRKKAIITGAGPAGLTAAYELLKRTTILPIIIEKDSQPGGISKTVDYKGNKMDFGPHRFFSKSDRVMNWWTNILPLHSTNNEKLTISYQNKSRTLDTGDLSTTTGESRPPEKSMLIIPRLTRIYFLRQFFNYPIQLSIATLGQLGLTTTIKIVCSYLYARVFPRKPEKSLEDFMINKFGKVLYHLFFKDYTEKVWGVDCNNISAEWGAQRIKGVSLSKAIMHAAKSITQKKGGDINQKGTETSLIEQFLYPAQGAGAMWEEVARQVVTMGGEIHFNQTVREIEAGGRKSEVGGMKLEEESEGYNDQPETIHCISAIDTVTGETNTYHGDYFFSTMPVQELIAGMNGVVPEEVKEVAAGLLYRDFIYAGVLVKKMAVETPKDSWIYIQERNVKVARMQVYNNWGPYMVKDPDTVWLGLEYFCNKGDATWNLSNAEIEQLAVTELIDMNLVLAEDVLDTTVQRMEKTYPAYFGTYDRFDTIRHYLDKFANLFLVGRNGMHKYNNADHSMLTAMVAVDNIIDGITSKENLWAINTEQAYHEEKKETEASTPGSANPLPGIEEEERSPIGSPARAAAFSGISFRDFLWKNKRNRITLWVAAIAIVAQFCVFKYFYPFAGFIYGDSFVYLDTAVYSKDINTYMVGYGHFLRFFSTFTKSDTALVAFQYLFLQASVLYFLFSLFYFYKPGKGTQVTLLVFMVLNPLFLYLSNYVSSDSLFVSLSMVWFTLLLWIVHQPGTRLLVWHALVLYIAFTVRYNALIYPFIAAIAFGLSKMPLRKKLIGWGAAVLLVGSFVLYTGYQYKKLTGTWQYSPFSGWQWTNNAMYAYRYVDSADRKPVPKKYQVLDNMIRQYFDSTRDVKRFPIEALQASTVYMWSPGLTMYKYRNDWFKQHDSTAGEYKRWASMGPFYSEYGQYIIKQYPLHFLRYFIWPNANKYYAPPVEFLEGYNSMKDSLPVVAQAFFGLKSPKVSTRTKDFTVRTLDFYPILSGIINVVMLFGLICFGMLQGFKHPTQFRKVMLLGSTVWLLNAGFTIFSSSAALRFQSFPILLTTVFAVLLVDWLWKAATVAGHAAPGVGRQPALSI